MRKLALLPLLLCTMLACAQSLPLGAGSTVQGISGTATAVTYTVFGSTTRYGSTPQTTQGILAQGQLPNSAAALYTVPVSTNASITTIILANTTGSTVSGVILYINGNAASNQLIPSLSIPANGSVSINGQGQYQLHDSNGRLYASASWAVGLQRGLIADLPATCTPGDVYFATNATAGANIYSCTAANTWTAPAATILPSGSITLITSGTCGSGFAEAADLDGFTVIGTVAANMNVGTTGGSDTLTPAGTVSQPTFTGNSDTTSSTSAGTPAGTNSAPSFTGNSVTSSATSAGTPTVNSLTAAAQTVNSLTAAAQAISGSTGAEASHTHAVTAAGTNASGAFSEGAISWPVGVPTNASGAFTEGAISWPVGVPTISGVPGLGTLVNVATATSGNCAATNVAIGTGATNACKATAPNLTVPAEGHSGALTSGTLANAWPAGVPTIAAGSFTQPTISWPMGVPTIAAGVFTQPTFSGSGVTSGAGSSHLHAVGTLANATSAVTGTMNNSAVTGTLNALGTHTHDTTATGSVTAPTFTGSALAGHTHTLTATGTVSQPNFTGNSADNRSAFTKVIFCRKT